MSGLDDTGVDRIAVERRRQVVVEGWTEAHDDDHDLGELAGAAAAYVLTARDQVVAARTGRPTDSRVSIPPSTFFPSNWDEGWWKPSDDPVTNLVKAGALVAAEIDRVLRSRQHPDDVESWTPEASDRVVTHAVARYHTDAEFHAKAQVATHIALAAYAHLTGSDPRPGDEVRNLALYAAIVGLAMEGVDPTTGEVPTRTTKTFDRWKYAEEHAFAQLRAGRLVSITVRPDVDHHEDGEVYTYDEYVVTDLGPRPEVTP